MPSDKQTTLDEARGAPFGEPIETESCKASTPHRTTINQWRETVRDIYDRLHFEEPGFFSGDPLAKELIGFIEERHPGYFNEPHTLKESHDA